MTSGGIRLLFFLPTYTFGGAERTSLNLLKGINKDRFRICLVTSKIVYRHFENIGIEKFIPIEELGISVWFGRFRRFMRDVRRVASLLERESPDIAFGMMHYPSSLLVFAAKLFNFEGKVVVSPRGPSTEYLKHFEPKFFRKMFLKWIFTFFCRRADGIVVASKGMKEECIKDFHALPERIKVVPNSVDCGEIVKRTDEKVGDVDVPPEHLLISTSGRLEREKNMPFLLRVFSEVRGKIKAGLLVIGDGTERAMLERLSREMKVGEDVFFIGHQGNPFKYIKRSDIFVHTCLFEGFANVIIEAMACGVPVVAIDCPYGPRDIISHMENGLLVPMGDERALVDAILTLANDRELRESIARKGLERAMDFSVDDMVKNYEAFFLRTKGSI